MKKSELQKVITFLFFIFLIMPKMSVALPMSEFPASPWTQEKSYLSKTVGKLGFGLVNVVGGWTGIVSEFHEEPEENIAVAGMRALARVVTNTVGGALHVVTFPVPKDIPLPGGGTSFE